jgi:hypothetical protein
MKIPLLALALALALAALAPFSLADQASFFYNKSDCSGTADEVGVLEDDRAGGVGYTLLLAVRAPPT